MKTPSRRDPATVRAVLEGGPLDGATLSLAPGQGRARVLDPRTRSQHLYVWTFLADPAGRWILRHIAALPT